MHPLARLPPSPSPQKNNSLQAYYMMAPFFLWMACLCIIYGVSIVLLRGCVTPVSGEEQHSCCAGWGRSGALCMWRCCQQ